MTHLGALRGSPHTGACKSISNRVVTLLLALCPEIKQFLDANQNEVITLFYEDYSEVGWSVPSSNRRRRHSRQTRACVWVRFLGPVGL
jgi:hypothetical protein